IPIVRNETGNYLTEWLKNVGSIADYHIFLDDGSDDDTPDVIARHLETHPGQLHRRKTSLFRENEPALRGQLWEYVRRTARPGDWVWIVDADEFYDHHLVRLKPKLLANEYPDADVVKTSCLDMWNKTSYRTDGLWSPEYADTRIIRFHDVPFGATGSELHMPPYPASTDLTRNLKIWIPKIHMAYLRHDDKMRRYKFYTANVSTDTNPAYHRHALSIADTHVTCQKYITPMQTLAAYFRGRTHYLRIRRILKKYGK
ncbi:MAG: glycosyltransferase family 2 protein, partial [Alphaproteobacteria bacterium]|nr:glycosyltransferase family 2 protein [Alphaproteobacteria bacterium]